MKIDVDKILINGVRRWLHLLDLNPCSQTYGVADREFWAWKTKDFANGTLQAGLSAFLDCYKSLELYRLMPAGELIKAILHGTHRIQRRDGSFEEALPYEGSYAVTGLVQFNLLYSLNRHSEYFSSDDRALVKEICDKSNAFLCRTHEAHGLISNHRATSELAILLWRHAYGGTASVQLPFLKLQDGEGWFPEYGGADPGYQTLLNHYINAYRACGVPTEQSLLKALDRSVAFIDHFTYPDGDFAGEIGSRGTRILYPSGLVSSDGKLSSWFEKFHLQSPRMVCPLTVDIGNFVPVLSSWALYYSMQKHEGHKVPSSRIEFASAGLRVYTCPDRYIAVNVKNGAILSAEKVEGWRDNSLASVTDGVNASQQGQCEILEDSDERLVLELGASSFKQQLNNPLRYSLLKIAFFFFGLVPGIKNLLKRSLARFVMGRDVAGAKTGCLITIDKKNVRIVYQLAPGWRPIRHGFFKHMASANTFVEGTIFIKGGS